jgi:hypothetical protein
MKKSELETFEGSRERILNSNLTLAEVHPITPPLPRQGLCREDERRFVPYLPASPKGGQFKRKLMEELHTDSIDGGHEANYGLGHVPGRGRTPTKVVHR